MLAAWKSGEASIRQAQHVGSEGGDHLLGQGDLSDRVGVHGRSDHCMGTALAEGNDATGSGEQLGQRLRANRARALGRCVISLASGCHKFVLEHDPYALRGPKVQEGQTFRSSLEGVERHLRDEDR